MRPTTRPDAAPAGGTGGERTTVDAARGAEGARRVPRRPFSTRGRRPARTVRAGTVLAITVLGGTVL
ncbi:hypothetical protein, partial [Candidatus Frankia alpina]|uniref:hypothetical protein n=1 Tax=Candidatus Frankia alpina TaxID=2699483 RepID=UPI001F2D9F8E